MIRPGVHVAAVILSPGILAAMIHGRAAGQEPSNAPSIKISRHHETAATLTYWQALEKKRPPLRGYRASILGAAEAPWPFEPPGDEAPEAVRQAAEIVGRRIARDGVLATLARVIKTLEPNLSNTNEAEQLSLLRQIGFPVDLLRHFRIEGNESRSPIETVRFIQARFQAGQSLDALLSKLAGASFGFVGSDPNFAVATESGEHDIAMLRFQISARDYARGEGDGSAIDITRQLVRAFPNASFLASVSEDDLNGFLAIAGDWPFLQSDRFQLCAEPLDVAQWAQDNGKPGHLQPKNEGVRRLATLVPRYASVGEESTKFVPGESFLMKGISAAGHRVIQSPLVFQGGNLLPLYDPANGERTLLIGEAEIFRNTALGLTESQALQAFCIEFGVDRCIVLPAVSFHIDFEVCARAVGEQLVFFVNDTQAAVDMIVRLGIDALAKHGLMKPEEAESTRAFLDRGERLDAANALGNCAMSQVDGDGVFQANLADAFTTGPLDSGPINLKSFLLALDILTSLSLTDEQMPPDPLLRAFVNAIRNQEADRKAMHRQLASLGWKLAPIPGLPSTDRGINYLNGIHERSQYVMPIHGAFYSPLDELAESAFRNAIGPGVKITPVVSRESQVALGAVHCAVAAYPKPN